MATRAILFVRHRRHRDAWTQHYGEAAELCARLDKTKAPAFIRTNTGLIIGYTEECDGRCDNRRPHKWHAWYELGEPYAGMTACPWQEAKEDADDV